MSVIIIIFIILSFLIIIYKKAQINWSSDSIIVSVAKYYDNGNPELVNIRIDKNQIYFDNDFVKFENITKASTSSLPHQYRIRNASPYMSNPYRKTTIYYLNIYYKSKSTTEETSIQFYSIRSSDSYVYETLKSYINKRINYEEKIVDTNNFNEL